jgi:hypothetical protein
MAKSSCEGLGNPGRASRLYLENGWLGTSINTCTAQPLFADAGHKILMDGGITFPGGQLGAKLAECGEPCPRAKPGKPAPRRDRALRRRPAGLSRWARCFVRTIDIGSLSTMTLSRENNEVDIASDQNRPLEISRLEFESGTRVSGGEPVRALDADAPLLLGALVARPKNRDSLPITIQSPVSG